MISILKKTVIGLFIGLLIIILSVLSYCWYLSGSIEKRFSGRKWKLPSSVYSDVTHLFPGKTISAEDLETKLLRLEYKQVDNKPENKGEFCTLKKSTEIFFRDLNVPGKERAGFRAVIQFRNKGIKKIERLDSVEPVTSVYLDPELIMQYFGNERELRKIVSIKHIPEHLVHAVLAAEDGRFFTHLGIDPFGVLRAFYVNFKAGYIQQGGSTLTQQLSKNYFLTPERTIRRKINEIMISIAIELKYSKEDILEIYLNEIYFGQKASVSINGIGEAANFYFGKEVGELSVSESAVLAGLIKAPNKYSPYSNMEKSKIRRDQVLYAMHKKKWLDDDALKTALDEPVVTVGIQKKDPVAPYLMDYISSQLNDLYPETVISRLSFSIYSTLDMEVQKAAEEALEKGLKKMEEENSDLVRSTESEKLQGAVIVMEPVSGNILAMVGGRNYRHSQFNRITQAKRQAGSCFKPFVVAALLDMYKPSDLLSNAEMSYMINGAAWTPDNYVFQPEKTMTVRDMLRTSCNRAAVDMVVTSGPGNVAEGVKAFGFSTAIYPYASIALGAFEVIPVEMASAYCAFAADGRVPVALPIKDVVDENGHMLMRKYTEDNNVISPSGAYIMTSMLETVVRTGTARTLSRFGINFPLAGKTGSTNGYKDAWFVGYTPDILVLVWVGFDNGDSLDTTGSGAAVPVFAELVKNIPNYITKKPFSVPSGVVKLNICRKTRKIASNYCPETYYEYFLDDNRPENTCSMHTKSVVHDVDEEYEGFEDFDFDLEDYERFFE